MMTRIENGHRRDPEFCKNVLVATSLAYRPLSLGELAVIADLPPKIPPQHIVEKCGSFLTIIEKTVYPIHQSAKDYLMENYESRLQPAGVAQGHVDTSMRCIDAMSRILKRNMYSLDYGFKPKDMRPPEPDPLASIRYSCVFWADHLCFLDSKCSELQRELVDDSRVHRFLKERFLRWLESVSLLGKLSDGVQSMMRLLHMVQLQSATKPIESISLLGKLSDGVQSMRRLLHMVQVCTSTA
jgi:hypothetical protein